MKKILSLMLGLTLVLGTSLFAAEDKPADHKTSSEKKKKKAKKDHTTKPADAKK